MTKIGKNPIQIPATVDVKVADMTITVKGPLGTLSRHYHEGVQVAVEGGFLTVTPANSSKLSRSLWGTTAAHVKNMIKGVNEKYTKKLEIQGVGYKVEMQGKNLKFALGFSHPVIVPIPAGIDVAVEKNVLTITGIDKDALGQFAASVRANKKPEPYKGKGIRYQGEYVRSKQGKKAVG